MAEIETRRAERLNRLFAVTDSLLDRLEQAATELDAVIENHREKVKTEDGEHSWDYQQRKPEETGMIDRAGLKQLTAVVKDIKDVLTIRPDADAREQEARVARIERDLQRETELGGQVTVTLEGESADYAK